MRQNRKLIARLFIATLLSAARKIIELKVDIAPAGPLPAILG
jgi:hypothetical protein